MLTTKLKITLMQGLYEVKVILILALRLHSNKIFLQTVNEISHSSDLQILPILYHNFYAKQSQHTNPLSTQVRYDRGHGQRDD